MNIFQKINQSKEIAKHGSELIGLRLRVLHLDAQTQLRGVLQLFGLLALGAVLLLIGGIALLFAIDAMVSEYHKGKVFLTFFLICVMMSVAVAVMLPRIWRDSSAPLTQTLADLQQDIAQITQSQSRHEDE